MRSSVLVQLVLLVSAVFFLAPAECLSQTPPESHTVSVNGAEIYYQTFGEGDPLVLLHGFLSTGKLFDPVLEDFARNFRVIIPDLRGHGGSTIQAKTLIVHGDRDWCFPVSMATEIYEAIPDAALWVIPGGGHVPVFGDWKSEFTEVAVEFLEGS